MRLSELSPRWVGHGNAEAGVRTGITFLCPTCKVQRLGVAFKPWIIRGVVQRPLLGEDLPRTPSEWWRQGGENFETLTLNPSLNNEMSGHWHGNIIAGEIQ